jgi:hypothetical protein
MVTTEKKEIDLFMDKIQRDFLKHFYEYTKENAIKATKKKMLDSYLMYRKGAFTGLQYSTDKNKRFLRKMRRGEI